MALCAGLALIVLGLATTASATADRLELDRSVRLDLAVYMAYYSSYSECRRKFYDSENVAAARYCACVLQCPHKPEDPFADSYLQCAHRCLCDNPTARLAEHPVYPNFQSLHLTNTQLFETITTELCLNKY